MTTKANWNLFDVNLLENIFDFSFGRPGETNRIVKGIFQLGGKSTLSLCALNSIDTFSKKSFFNDIMGYWVIYG